MPTKTSTPLSCGYHSELDVSPLHDDDETNYYQNMIGILHWAVELGRIDIHVDVAYDVTLLVQPRMGHMNELYHIFAYLKSHMQLTMAFDEAHADINETKFPMYNWQDFYYDAKEMVPPNAFSQEEIRCK